MLLLTDDRFSVVAGYVIEARSTLDNDCETVFSSLRIVGLTGTPVMPDGGGTTRPGHATGSVVDPPASPEVRLALSREKVAELVLLLRGVEGDGRHPVGGAVGRTLRRCEAVAPEPP